MIMVIVDDYDHDYGAILHRHNLFCFARHIVQRWWQMWRELSLWRNAATDLPPDWHNCDIIVCYFLFRRMYIFKPFLLPGHLEGHCFLRYSWIDCKLNYFQWSDGQNQRSNCFKGGVGELRLASSEIKKPPEPSIFWRLNAQLLLSWVASEFVSSHCLASRKTAMRLTGLMHWEWVRCTAMHHLRQMSEMIILLFVICNWGQGFVKETIPQTLFF